MDHIIILQNIKPALQLQLNEVLNDIKENITNIEEIKGQGYLKTNK